MPLPHRRIGLNADSHLSLEPDPDRPSRYLVRFCGLHRDRAARAATERARVRLMLASLRGQAPYPYPLPARLVIGWLDRTGWHPGRSDYAAGLAALPAVQAAIATLEADLLLRVALAAAGD
ncbi:MAG: hypothetical protein EA400_07390 [Chromatiaceae bacterium]|nr:MAG: hypothetical protein EA400_07390 [Chromatiaceae bacterium]